MFRVGDYVTIRDWDDMANEFSVEYGSIKCRCNFIPEMRYLCGVSGVIETMDGYQVWITDEYGNALHSGYSISTDMIRLTYDFPEFSEDSFAELLGGEA